MRVKNKLQKALYNSIEDEKNSLIKDDPAGFNDKLLILKKVDSFGIIPDIKINNITENVFKNSNIVSNNPVKRNKEYILSSTNILTGNACNYRTADASTQIIKNPVLLNPTKPLHSIKIHTDFQYLQNLLKIENIGPLIKVLPTNKHINSYRESQLHGSLSPLKEFIELQKNEIQHNIDEDNKEDSIVLNSAKSKEQKIAITNYILMKSSNKYKVFFTII